MDFGNPLGESEEQSKTPFITGSLIKEILHILVDAAIDSLVSSGKLHEKNEGYDFKKDMPKTDKGEDLY